MTRDQILNYTTDTDTRFNWERIRDRYADISENYAISWTTLLEHIDRNIPPLNTGPNPWHITTPSSCEYTIDGVFFDEEAEVAIAYPTEPIQLSEHELLKFLEEE